MAQRWLKLFPVRRKLDGSPEIPTKPEIDSIVNQPEVLDWTDRQLRRDKVGAIPGTWHRSSVALAWMRGPGATWYKSLDVCSSELRGRRRVSLRKRSAAASVGCVPAKTRSVCCRSSQLIGSVASVLRALCVDCCADASKSGVRMTLSVRRRREAKGEAYLKPDTPRLETFKTWLALCRKRTKRARRYFCKLQI